MMRVFILTVVIFAISACQTSALEPFHRSLNTTAYGYTSVDDPTGSAPSATVDRFEVRAGDCGVGSTWSDCANDRERSELSSSIISGETWIHWSIYLPQDYPVIYPVKTALAQFHQKNGHVVWMFQNDRGGYYVDNQTIGKTLEKIQILTDEDMRGHWTDVLVHVKWSSGRDGFFMVYVNGESKPRYTWFGKTHSPGKQVYFKYGIYRSFVSRREGPEPTQVVYYADVGASPACDAAITRFDCSAIQASLPDAMKAYEQHQEKLERARQSQGKILEGQQDNAAAACKDANFAKLFPDKCGK